MPRPPGARPDGRVCDRQVRDDVIEFLIDPGTGIPVEAPTSALRECRDRLGGYFTPDFTRAGEPEKQLKLRLERLELPAQPPPKITAPQADPTTCV